MKAIVKYADGPQGYGLLDVLKPVPKKNELLVKVKTVGICGTDIHVIRDEYPHSTPVTLGHEYVGTVVEMGEEAQGFEIGDTIVSLACAFTCNECKYCKSGLPMMCANRLSIGSWNNGAMTEYIVVPARSCFKVPGAPSDEMAAYEPAACCARSVIEVGEIEKDDIVLISGAGFMGHICLQLCKYKGARVVMAGLPQDKERLALALEMGADAVATSGDEIAAVLKQLGEDGFTAAFECAAAPASLQNCIRYCTKHGRIIQVGLYGKSIPVDLDIALYKELQLRTSFGSNPSSWKLALDIVAEGGLNLKPYLTHVVPFSKWEQAFADMASGKYYKILMHIDE